MITAVVTVSIHAPYHHSLKDKRREIRSLKQRLRSTYNISVIESESQDIIQTITLSFACLAATTQQADSIIDRVLQFVETSTQGELSVAEREFL